MVENSGIRLLILFSESSLNFPFTHRMRIEVGPEFGKFVHSPESFVLHPLCILKENQYFGSEESNRQIQEVAQAFAYAHELGMATILWCYTRNDAFKVDGVDYHTSADLTGQANHIGSTIGADIVKQKQPTNNGGYKALNAGNSSYGKLDERIYSELTSEHPIDLTRYQVVNSFMGRAGLINSGGASGSNDFADAVKTAVINKRAGGMGLISGRKAFQRPIGEGLQLLNMIQDVYLNKEVDIA